MTKTKLTPLQKRVEKNFKKLKKQIEERPPQIILGKKYFDQSIQPLLNDVADIKNKILSTEKKIDWMYEKIDWLYGEYQKHNTEHNLLSGQMGDLDERIEKLENNSQIVVQ